MSVRLNATNLRRSSIVTNGWLREKKEVSCPETLNSESLLSVGDVL
jgi:hypothetical protein